MRSGRALLAAAVLVACAPSAPVADVDAALPDDAFAGPTDAGDGLPQIDDLCLVSDGDAILGLVPNETLACSAGTDASAPLFPSLPTLPDEYLALHALCGRMNPTADTRDDLTDPALAADLRTWLGTLVMHPALERAFAGGPTDASGRVAALESVWLRQNGFEHVFCGELDAAGTGVSGLHMWSEWALAEGEGRANYLCTVAAIDRPEVSTIRYDWIPEMRTSSAHKTVGSFQIGMSPACMLALGYVAIQRGVVATPGATPSFHARMYDEEVSFTFAPLAGSIVTMFATEQ